MWVVYSLSAATLSALSAIASKNLSIEHGSYAEICTFIALVLTGFLAIMCLMKKNQKTKLVFRRVLTCKKTLGIVCIIAILNLVNWILWSRAIKEAPNAGYAHCLVNLNMVITLLISGLIFTDVKHDFKMIIGMISIFIGMYLVVHER